MSIFFDEWRECLREHYKYIIRINDRVTLKSLRGQMHDLGFSETELKELEILAFARIEDAPEGFVPDLEALRPAGEPVIHPAAVAPDATPAAEVPAADLPAAEQPTDSPEEPDPDDGPDQPPQQQLSLF